ncbi:MAG: hypothetical protein ABIF77_06005, partial [bacterium]
PLEPELLAHQEPSRAYTHLPAYIGHGELEPNLETVRATIPLLEELGFDVRLRVYPGARHELPEPILDELNRILTFFNEETGDEG